MIRLIESFAYISTSDFTGLYPGSTCPPDRAGRHADAGAVRYGSPSANVLVLPFTGRGYWVVGFAVKLLTSGAQSIFRFRNGANTQIEIATSADMHVGVQRANGAVWSQSAVSAPINTWHYYELKVQAGNANDGSYTLRFDGVTVLSETGVNTTQGGVSTFDNFQGWGDWWNEIDLTDLYVLDNQAGDTDFLGDCEVRGRLPISNGSFNEWTASPAVANYLNVDEASVNDGDTTHNESQTVGQRDFFKVTAPGANEIIFAVSPRFFAAKSDTGARLVRVVTRSGGTDYEEGDNGLGTTYQPLLGAIRTTDPATGARWTPTGLGAAEFGLKVSG